MTSRTPFPLTKLTKRAPFEVEGRPTTLAKLQEQGVCRSCLVRMTPEDSRRPFLYIGGRPLGPGAPDWESWGVDFLPEPCYICRDAEARLIGWAVENIHEETNGQVERESDGSHQAGPASPPQGETQEAPAGPRINSPEEPAG